MKEEIMSSDEIRKEWKMVDLGIYLLPGYEVYLRPNGEMHYLLFEKEIVLVFDPEGKSLVELLDVVLIHDYNQKR